MPIETPAAAPKPSSIRDSLSSSFDKATASPPSGAPASSAAPVKPAPVVEKKPVLKQPAGTTPVNGAAAGTPDRDAGGRFVAKPGQEESGVGGELQQGSGKEQPASDTLGSAQSRAGAAGLAPEGTLAAVVEGGAAVEPEKKPVEAKKTKPPTSWRPAAREVWDAIPPEAQAEALRLEALTKDALQKAATAQKDATTLQAAMGKLEEAARPYQAMLQAEGDIPKAFGGYLQTIHAMTHGTPSTRAAVVADVIRRFGIQPELIADALEGKLNAGESGTQPVPAQPQGAPAAPPTYRDPRVDQLLQMVQQGRQNRVQQTATAQQRTWAAFEADPKNEFLEPLEPGQEAEPGSVRDLMAMVWEANERENVARQKRGQPPLDLTLADAYSRACQLHPETNKVLRQREEAKRAETVNAATRQAQLASASVRSEPTGAAPAKPQGLRGVLEAAWNTSGGE